MVLHVKKKFAMLLSLIMVLATCSVQVSAESTVSVKQVDADTNFSRIEFTTTTDGEPASGVTVLAGEEYSFTFTPQKTGSYSAWFLRPQSFQVSDSSNTIAFSVEDSDGVIYDVPSYKALYHSQMKDVNPVLERINGAAGASPRNFDLTASVEYTVKITPSADLAPLYSVDFRCLDLPINDKTAISPADITNTGITDNAAIVRIPASFEGATAIDPEYTLVGNYAAVELARKDSQYRSMHPGTSWVEYTLDVETPGVYAITTYTGTYGFSGTKIIQNHFSLDGVLITSFSKEVEPAGQKFFETTSQFYLSGGRHTLKISTAGSQQGAYIGAIKFDLQTEANNMSVLDVSDTSAPVFATEPFFAGSAGAINADKYWTINNGESISLKFKSDTVKTLELYAKKIEVPEGASIEYVLDAEAPVETPLMKYGTIFEDKEITDGEHTLTITSKTDGVKISTLSFREKLTQNPAITDIASEGDTAIDLFSYTSSSGDVCAANEGTSLGFGAGSEIKYTINIQKDGLYTVYMNSLTPQCGFDIYVDDGSEPLTGFMHKYIESNGTNSDKVPLYDNTNVSYNRVIDRQLIMYGVQLNKGEHNFTLKFNNGYKSTSSTTPPVEITDDENFMSIVNQLWVSRMDPEVGSTNEVIIRAWDATADGPKNSGWSYINQFGQGGEQIIDGKSCRSTVFMNGLAYTYTFIAESDGYYDFSAYIKDHAASETVPNAFYTLSVDGGEAVNVPVPFSGGSSFLKTTTEKIYLTAGSHTFKIVAESANIPGVNRLYSISLAKSGVNSVVVDKTSNTAAVDAYFDAPYTGTAMVALYNDAKELVGIYQSTVSNADLITANIAYTGVPTMAKVFIWGDLTNVKPLVKNIEIASTDENWIEK